MINFDCLTLTALINEIALILIGGRVHKVQQPGKYVILLTIRAQGRNKKLCISAHPKYSYISIIEDSEREFVNPQKPPMFCMLLRKHMEGAKIIDIKQPSNERIMEIYFESFNELGDRMLMTLACEIMGKYSNVILYVADSKLILGCAHNVGELMSSQRELAGSLPYVLPPAQNKMSFLSISLQQFKQMSLALQEPIDVWMSSTFYNICLALARELCKTALINVSDSQSTLTTVEKIEKLYTITTELLEKKQFKPSLSKDKEFYSLLATDPTVEWQQVSGVNKMVDLYFAHHINKDTLKSMKSNLQSRINREIKRISNKLNKLEENLDKAYNADNYRIKGDLLTANLHKIDTACAEVILENYYDDNKPVTISLDKMLSPNQNAQKYYKLYNKAKNSLQITLERKQNEIDEINYLESVLLSVDQASEIKILEEIQEELNSQLQSQKVQEKQSRQKINLKISTFLSSDDFEILVGRNNKQNDFLISKLAHPNDLWLHTQSAHGSHVIVRTDRGNKEVPEATLHEAALLAGYFSQGRHSSNVEVVYTLKKFVKKPTGAKPGFVVYSKEKTLYVNPLEEHVSHILEKIQV